MAQRPAPRRGPKYAPLAAYLAAYPGDHVRLTFAQIEMLLGAPLPASAWLRQFWTNPTGRRTGRVQTRAWLEVGWRVVAVDRAARVVTFVRHVPPVSPQQPLTE